MEKGQYRGINSLCTTIDYAYVSVKVSPSGFHVVQTIRNIVLIEGLQALSLIGTHAELLFFIILYI